MLAAVNIINLQERPGAVFWSDLTFLVNEGSDFLHGSDSRGGAQLPAPALCPALPYPRAGITEREGWAMLDAGRGTQPFLAAADPPTAFQCSVTGKGSQAGRGGELLSRLGGDAVLPSSCLGTDGGGKAPEICCCCKWPQPAASRVCCRLSKDSGLWRIYTEYLASNQPLGLHNALATAFWEMLNIPSITPRSKTILGLVYQAFLLLCPQGNGITICVSLWYVITKHPVCTWHALSAILYTAYWHVTAAAGPQRFSWFLLFIPGFHWHKRNGSLLGSFLQSDCTSSGRRKSSHLISAWKISGMKSLVLSFSDGRLSPCWEYFRPDNWITFTIKSRLKIS